jgi:hypothetical protein
VIWYLRRFLQGVDDHVFHSGHRFVMTFVSTSVKMSLQEQVGMKTRSIVATPMLLPA